MTSGEKLIDIARRLAGDLAEYSQRHDPATKTIAEVLPPTNDLLAEYDRRVVDPDLRAASRSRFVALRV